MSQRSELLWLGTTWEPGRFGSSSLGTQRAGSTGTSHTASLSWASGHAQVWPCRLCAPQRETRQAGPWLCPLLHGAVWLPGKRASPPPNPRDSQHHGLPWVAPRFHLTEGYGRRRWGWGSPGWRGHRLRPPQGKARCRPCPTAGQCWQVHPRKGLALPLLSPPISECSPRGLVPGRVLGS